MQGMKKRMRGFTLLELMVVVVIAALLLGIGVPAMGNFIRNARMTSSANDMLAAMHYARSEAIKRRLPVTVCATPTPLAEPPAVPVCTDQDDMTAMGWIVFVDPNRNGTVDVTSFDDADLDGVLDPAEDLNGDGIMDPGEDLNLNGALDPAETVTGIEEVMQRRPALADGIGAVAAVPLRVTYLDTGFTAVGSANALVMCDSRGNVASGGELSAARAITVSQTGRPQVSRNKAEIAAIGDCP